MKKLIAIALCLSIILTVMCACKPKDKDKGSSTNTAVESSDVQNESSDYSENKTSSIADDDDETSSFKKYESSKKDDEDSSSEKTSSKAFNRNPSVNMTDNTTTTSSAIKLPDIDGTTKQIGAFNFNPMYTINYSGVYNEINKDAGAVPMSLRLKEIEDVFAAGYFNNITLEPGHIDNEELWKIIEKYKIRVWFMIWSKYDSSEGETIDEWMSKYTDEIENVRKNAKRWAMVDGFAYDENVHRNQSPEDFNATCKYVYTKYGKRNFPVFAPQEISDLWDAPEWPGEMNTAAFEYVTDVAYDIYTVDVREVGNVSQGYIDYGHSLYPEITDGKSFHKVITNEMLKMAGHPVNVWAYPPAYTSWGSDSEAYCLAQLKFFEQHIQTYDYPGGLILYNYPQNAKGQYMLQSHLYVPDSNGNQKIRPHEGQVWYKYSEYLRDLTMRFRSEKTTQLLKPTGK